MDGHSLLDVDPEMGPAIPETGRSAKREQLIAVVYEVHDLCQRPAVMERFQEQWVLCVRLMSRLFRRQGRRDREFADAFDAGKRVPPPEQLIEFPAPWHLPKPWGLPVFYGVLVVIHNGFLKEAWGTERILKPIPLRTFRNKMGQYVASGQWWSEMPKYFGRLDAFPENLVIEALRAVRKDLADQGLIREQPATDKTNSNQVPISEEHSRRKPKWDTMTNGGINGFTIKCTNEGRTRKSLESFPTLVQRRIGNR